MTPSGFTSTEAAAHVGNKTVKAFYAWAKRHGITRDGLLWPRADIERAKRRGRRTRRQMAPASLANLTPSRGLQA